MTFSGDNVFDGADLSDASLLRPSAFSTLAAPASEAVSFVGVNLKRARIFGRFNRGNFAGADLTEAIRIDPKCAIAYHRRSLAYQALNDQAKAQADMQTAVRLDPTVAKK